ncbi:MAG: site-specific DNA-methyltransferase [Chloroflexi bacterium]|nr:site-specific DNA-methyltransferase [Chloroflexota bacterium]
MEGVVVLERIILAGSSSGHQALADHVPPQALVIVSREKQRGIPSLAKDAAMVRLIEQAVRQIPTHHCLILGDSRRMEEIPDESVHLVVTSPPYWNLKEYPAREGQLGLVDDYEAFLDELDRVWRHVLRVLVHGGRLVVVVGDVCLPRRAFGRHVVFPLHASIQERCRKIGFDNLAPIIWYKIANAQLEVDNGSHFLGKPYEPNAIVKNDIEYILFQRKPGGYRQPDLSARILSVIPESCHREWFQQLWTLTGASTRQHPAPFPLGLAERLIRMFSFVGDTVLDPFGGTGTTNLAASRWGRHSIGLEIEPTYYEMMSRRLKESQRAVPMGGLDERDVCEPSRASAVIQEPLPFGEQHDARMAQ